MSRRKRISVVLLLALGLSVAAALARAADAPSAARAGEMRVSTIRHRATIGELMRLGAARASATRAGDDDEAFEHEQVRVDRSSLPQNAASPAVSRWPPDRSEGLGARPQAAPSAPQPVGLSFSGATYAGAHPSMLFPPDCMGAVGPTQVVVLVNGRLATYDKASGAPDSVLDITPDAFFGGSPPYTTDPRVRYDRLSARWILTINRMNSPDMLVLAVSDSGGVLTSTTAFVFTTIPVDSPPPAISTTCFADFPTLAVDANAVYIGTNNFCGVGTTGDGSDVYVIRKRSLWDTIYPAVFTVFRGVSSATTEGPFTPQGVDNFDPAATEGYVIGSDNMFAGTLSLLRVADPGGTPTISAAIPIAVPATAPSIRVAHLGNVKGVTGMLDGLDDRLTSAVLRGRRLWTSHNIGVDNTGVSTGLVTRNGSRWYELDVPAVNGTPTLVQSGTVFTPSVTNISDQRSYWMPSLMVSGQGHVAMGFSTAGSAEHINAAATGRLASDPPGTMQAVQMLTNSLSSYNPSRNVGGPIGRRWGDYSYTCVDPLDDQTLWTVQEFCDQTASWAVLVAKLLAPPPATPANCPDVSAGLALDVVTLTGLSTAGSGFFDPGADPPAGLPFHHLSVAVTHSGVTGTPPAVVSAAVVDATTITLTLDASAATANLPGEAYTVVVTNPDGQLASAPVLHVANSVLGVPAARGAAFTLGPARPNPTTGATRIAFTLPRAAFARAGVLDVQGREIAVLANGAMAAGTHELEWSSRTARGPAPAGVYFVRVRAEGRERVRRLVVAR